jgi:Methane/Phenol/Alkene Hydroxylase
LLISFDWDDAFVGLNRVVKPLADEITLRQFAVVARLLGVDLDALIADNLFLDAERSRRWSAALTRFPIAQDEANREHLLALQMAPDRWRDRPNRQPLAWRSLSRFGRPHRGCRDRGVA